ncbi:MAG: hypothetical protein ACK4OK_01320 [Thermoflexus sp.]
MIVSGCADAPSSRRRITCRDAALHLTENRIPKRASLPPLRGE